ncbi:MAG TPA: STAS domain-containing protein [Candidatus Baltobacteraceae bacterium]|jgi:anti-sigma B factor antagonist
MQESVAVTISFDKDSAEPAVIAITGELDLSNCDAVRARLDEVGLIATRVILDLQDLDFIDSTGLSTVVRLGKQVKERGGQLAVVVTKPSIRKLFSITALDKRFAISESIEEVHFSD